MKRAGVRAASFIAGVLLCNFALAADDAHWGYVGDIGPEHWGALAPAFSACSEGKNQSPIDLTGMVEGDLPELRVDYQAGGNEIVNNGHSIQVNYAPGSTVSLGEHSFELKQFHFHSPSENAIDGRSFPLEAHFVHEDEEGNIAVMAVMFEEGEANTELEKAWAHMPEKAGQQHELASAVDASLLLPQARDYYRFNGSLTTPPCSEGVWWIVMKQVGTVSTDQRMKFARTMRHPNNRPLQPLRARMIIQ